MYFWNINKLKKDIKNNTFTEKDRFLYGFIYIGLGIIATEAIMFMPKEKLNSCDIFDAISTSIIAITGIILAFKANGGASGIDFLGKYFSISFVITIRFTILFIVSNTILQVYYVFAYPDQDIVGTTFLESLILLFWNSLLFWRIIKHIGDVKDENNLNSRLDEKQN